MFKSFRIRLILAGILTSLVLFTSNAIGRLENQSATTKKHMQEEILRLHINTTDNYQRIVKISAQTGIPIERVKITTWRPDTASCIAEYAWDRDSTEAARVHYPVGLKCADNNVPFGLENFSRDWTNEITAKPTVEQDMQALWAENHQKNIAVGILAAEQRVPADEVKWYIDGLRRVYVGTEKTEYAAADVIQNKPAGLETDPQKYLSAKAYTAYVGRTQRH